MYLKTSWSHATSTVICRVRLSWTVFTQSTQEKFILNQSWWIVPISLLITSMPMATRWALPLTILTPFKLLQSKVAMQEVLLLKEEWLMLPYHQLRWLLRWISCLHQADILATTMVITNRTTKILTRSLTINQGVMRKATTRIKLQAHTPSTRHTTTMATPTLSSSILLQAKLATTAQSTRTGATTAWTNTLVHAK